MTNLEHSLIHASRWRTWRISRSVAVVGLMMVSLSIVAATSPVTIDRPETGLQGQAIAEDKPGTILPQPYSKGVNLVGHDRVEGRRANIQMAWVDHCAYISGSGESKPHIGFDKVDPATSGVAVVDVSDPAQPKTVRLLRDRGALSSLEALHAVENGERRVLAAGTYENGAEWLKPEDAKGWISIYDVSDCAAPVLQSEYQLPESIHTLTVSANGKRVYATSLSPFTGDGGIHVLDISDMAKPRYLGKFSATRQDGSSFEFASHELSLSADERRIYAAVIASKGGDLNEGIQLYPPNARGLGTEAGGVYIFDNTDIAEGRPNPKMRLLGTAQQGGWHSVMVANINGVPHLVAGAELGVCPATWPKIINIADETAPFIVGEFKLEMNQRENCPPPSKEELASIIAGAPGTASLHYNDVDSATETRLGLFQFMWAGLRIADLRDPANPKEIAYFKPGDACGGHVRYRPETGHIWLSCGQSGFYVIELKAEQLRGLKSEE